MRHKQVDRLMVQKLWLRPLLTLALVCCVPMNSHEFCAHSVREGVRVKRDDQLSNHHHQQAQHRASPQEPEHKQEDQIVIDEDAKGPAKGPENVGDRSTEARIECPKGATAVGSRSDSRPELAAQGQEIDCLNSKTIETAVFIDNALDNKFNGLSGGLVELNKLVLTIMNQVQYLFKYSSMKVPIKIKLILVEHLRESERRGESVPNPEKGDIDVYLNNFCLWQQRRLEREKRLWWDHAILLSGMDLYKATQGRNHTGVLGLAWVGGMCKSNYSCTINEASNLESAFVIAHEIGHSLGIMHDGQRNTCDPNGFIMSERTGAGKVHWSKCSINYLNDSINRRQLTCLDGEQSASSDPLYDLTKLKAPGQVYTINDQCKLAFGSNYTSFVTRQQPFDSVCRELWCVAGTWAKAAHPALEGSACGDKDRFCREGKCIR